MRAQVVLCGTYHRDSGQLKRLFRELETTGCHILAPLDIDFIDLTRPIVRTGDELDFNIDELERFHLRAMKSAHFIWLHNPGGHVGLSASFEIGFATALGKPIFCLQAPSDEMLATQVQVVASVFAALDQMQLTSF